MGSELNPRIKMFWVKSFSCSIVTLTWQLSCCGLDRAVPEAVGLFSICEEVCDNGDWDENKFFRYITCAFAFSCKENKKITHTPKKT